MKDTKLLSGKENDPFQQSSLSVPVVDVEPDTSTRISFLYPSTSVKRIFQPIYTDLLDTMVDHMARVRQMAEAGDIDQKYLYWDPSAFTYWSELIKSNTYRIYRSCAQALELLLQDDKWLELSADGIGAIVDLGVGAGNKNRQVIDHLLSRFPESEPELILVDTSFPMLEGTL